jgi:hypothetical protein
VLYARSLLGNVTVHKSRTKEGNKNPHPCGAYYN